jgi:hypothetical protein
MRALSDRHGRRNVTLIALGLAAVLIAGGAALVAARSDRGPDTSGPNSTPASRLEPYRGLATWVDLFDARAWADPAASVSDMAGHGVRTVFVETANAASTSGLVHPAELAAFVAEAHARHMYVVAWYLPNLRAGSADFDRVMQAIDFKTTDGQTFDSFALDIEATVVKPVSLRNQGLTTLSQQIRARVGPDYALGAIIPSPVGISTKKGFWSDFPYAMLATTYDVFLPMHYYSFSSHSAADPHASTLANMSVLRAQPGCSGVPVHMIGGIAGDSSVAQVKQFVRAAREAGCVGASLYDRAGMNPARWREMAAVNTSATP